MKDEEKKVKATKKVKTEENGVELTDEQLSEVSGGKENSYNKEITNAIPIPAISVTDSK